MKKASLAILLIALLISSCKKDHIYPWDYKNDCSKCIIYYTDVATGDKKSLNQDQAAHYFGGTKGVENWCNLLKTIHKDDVITDDAGNPVGTNLYYVCK